MPRLHSCRHDKPNRRRGEQGSEEQNDYILIIFGYCLSRPCARLRSWEPDSANVEEKTLLESPSQEIRGTHTRLSSGNRNTKRPQRSRECNLSSAKNGKAIFMPFDSITASASGTCPRYLVVRAFNCTRDRDMRELCEKYEHVKNFVFGSESCRKVMRTCEKSCLHDPHVKALSTPVPAGRNCRWSSTGSTRKTPGDAC